MQQAEHKALKQTAIADKAKGRRRERPREGEARAKEELRLRLVQNVDVANGFRRIEDGDPSEAARLVRRRPAAGNG